MSDHINVRGIRAFGYHGVLEHESRDGQDFIVDVTMFVDLAAAAASDNLADTVDYGAVALVVVDVVTGTRFQLIEALADEIGNRVLRDARVTRVEVTVHKPSAPIAVPFSDVSVTRCLP